MKRLKRFIILSFWLNLAGKAVSILMRTKQTLRLGAILTMVYYGIHREWTKLGTFRTVNSGLTFRS